MTVKSNMSRNFAKRGLRNAGRVTGPGGPEDDLVPAQLSAGEYVLPAKTVATLGGPEALDELVRSTNDGKEPIPDVIDGVAHAAFGVDVEAAKRAAGQISDKAVQYSQSLRDAAQPYVQRGANALRGAATTAADYLRGAPPPPAADAGPLRLPAPATEPGTPQKTYTEGKHTIRVDPAGRATVLDGESPLDRQAREYGARTRAGQNPVGGGGATPPTPPTGPAGAAPAPAEPPGALRRGAGALRRGLAGAGRIAAPIAALSAAASATDAVRKTDLDEYGQSLGLDPLKYDNSPKDLAKLAGLGLLRGVQGVGDDILGVFRGGGKGKPPAAAPAAPVVPGSAQDNGVRRALVDAGVPGNQLDRPAVPASLRGEIMRGARPDQGQFVNLGDYGSKADVYGSASRPGGRVDNFVSVASPGQFTSGVDLGLANARSQRAVDLRNAMIASQAVQQGGPREPSQYEQDLAAREQRMERDSLAARAGAPGFMPSGARQAAVAALNNFDETQRAREGHQVTREGNQLQAGTLRRGQDMNYDATMAGVQQRASEAAENRMLRGYEAQQRMASEQRRLTSEQQKTQREADAKYAEEAQKFTAKRLGLKGDGSDSKELVDRAMRDAQKLVATQRQLGLPTDPLTMMRMNVLLQSDEAQRLDDAGLTAFIAQALGMREQYQDHENLANVTGAMGVSPGPLPNAVPIAPLNDRILTPNSSKQGVRERVYNPGNYAELREAALAQNPNWKQPVFGHARGGEVKKRGLRGGC